MHSDEGQRAGTVGTANAKFELDFPAPLLDRLLASRIVPRRAKIAAIESWRHELAEFHSHDPRARELDRRLAKAQRVLKRRTLASVVAQTANLVGGLVRPLSRRNGLPRWPSFTVGSERPTHGLSRSRLA
jgi:hypothetical protein